MIIFYDPKTGESHKIGFKAGAEHLALEVAQFVHGDNYGVSTSIWYVPGTCPDE